MKLPAVGQRIQALMTSNGKTFEITGTVTEKTVAWIHSETPQMRLCVIAENDVSWHRKESQHCYIIDIPQHIPSPGHPERPFNGMLKWAPAIEWD